MSVRSVSGVYQVLVLVHVLSAMVWVGGGFLVLAVSLRVRRVGGLERAYRMMRELAWVDDWMFTPAPLLVIATGITMVIVSDAWAFSQPWVYLALTLIVIEFVTGTREITRLREAEDNGPGDPGYGAALSAHLRIGFVAIGMLVVIVVSIVFKPGL